MDAMNEHDNSVIQKKYVRLAKTLEAQNLLAFLYQEGVLSDHDKEKIGALQSTSEEKAEKLMDILKKRKDGLKMLIKALLVSRVQGFLGNELLESVTWSEEEMGTFKLELEGKIDQQQMLEANMAALKQENNQLKAKDKENQKTIKDLTERIEQLTQEKEANGGDARRQAKLSRTHAFVHTCNGKHRRSVSETR